MAKRKDSVALFEVIQKASQSEAKMDVPGWMSGGEPPASAEAARAASQQAARAQAASGEPWVAVVGDRLRLSLNTVSCAVAALGAVGLLAMVFALGWWGGSSGRVAQQAPPGDLRDRVPPGKHVLAGTRLDAGKGAGAGEPASRPAGGPSVRQKGKWYLVIQSLAGVTPGDLTEATRIAAFCQANGEPATVARYTHPRSGKQRYIVWSLTPFDSGSDAAAKAHGRKIEAMGKTYFAKHKTYDFRQQSAGGKYDPWFEMYR